MHMFKVVKRQMLGRSENHARLKLRRGIHFNVWMKEWGWKVVSTASGIKHDQAVHNWVAWARPADRSYPGRRPVRRASAVAVKRGDGCRIKSGINPVCMLQWTLVFLARGLILQPVSSNCDWSSAVQIPWKSYCTGNSSCIPILPRQSLQSSSVLWRQTMRYLGCVPWDTPGGAWGWWQCNCKCTTVTHLKMPT